MEIHTFHFEARPHFCKLHLSRYLDKDMVSASKKSLKGELRPTYNVAYLNEMKSSSFENVMTRLLSSFGTGKRYLRTSRIRSPSFEEKFSKMRCGYCSETVEDL